MVSEKKKLLMKIKFFWVLLMKRFLIFRFSVTEFRLLQFYFERSYPGGIKLYSGYTGATATLIFGGRAEIDPLKENCPDPKVYLVQTIDKLNRENPGQVTFFH